MRSTLLLAAATCAAALSLSAQALPKTPPPRPNMGAQADTNDPEAYWKYGGLDKTPWDKTQDAYYWAYRLDPEQPAYLLGMRDAVWFKQAPQWREEYDEGADYVLNSKEAKQIDSLYTLVYRLDPFAHIITPCYLNRDAANDEDSLWAGLVLEESGCYKLAAIKLSGVVARSPKQYSLHYHLAQDYFFTAQYGNVVNELHIYLDSIGARENKKTLFYYRSKPFIYAMIAEALARNGDMAGARDAYGQALTEDLTFYTAHARLSTFALADGDMDQAIGEIDQAVQIAPNNGVLRAQYGDALLNTTPKRYADAEVQLRKAIELEPYWAQPYYNLGVALEGQHKFAEAMQQYKAYEARLPRRAARLQQMVAERITAVQGELATKP